MNLLRHEHCHENNFKVTFIFTLTSQNNFHFAIDSVKDLRRSQFVNWAFRKNWICQLIKSDQWSRDETRTGTGNVTELERRQVQRYLLCMKYNFRCTLVSIRLQVSEETNCNVSETLECNSYRIQFTSKERKKKKK